MVDAARQAFAAGNRRVLLTAPTGAGKTVMFSAMVAAAAARGKRACVLVHREELLDQVSATLRSFRVAHSLIAAGKPMVNAAVQVASVFTLSRRMASAPAFDFVIVDEAHHVAKGNTWARVLERYDHAHILGVTATPVRLDGRGLGASFDVLVPGPQTADLIKQGYLVPARVLGPPAQIDTTGLATRGGDFERPGLNRRASSITGDIVWHYQRHASGKLAIAFCVSLEHANSMVAAFRSEGIHAEILDGKLPRDERAARVARFRARQTLVLCTCDLVSEGFDCPGIEVAIQARPTQSLGLHLQQVGRALRPAPGKSEALILDHAGNYTRHGLPDWEREWKLTQDKQRPGKPPTLRTCSHCYAVVRSTVRECPVCHVAITAPGLPKERKLTVQDGELIDVSALAAMPYRDALRWARTEAQLEEVRKARGYHRAWVDHIIANRIGGGR